MAVEVLGRKTMTRFGQPEQQFHGRGLRRPGLRGDAAGFVRWGFPQAEARKIRGCLCDVLSYMLSVIRRRFTR